MELVSGIKKIIEKQSYANKIKIEGESFSECQKTYFWTNENISGCLDIYDLSDKSKGLCVLASGDHAFNLITKGILIVDTFDTNRFTEYFAFGLKRALILKYNYFEYFDVINKITSMHISIDELTSILIDLLPFMDSHHRSFWQEIINYNYKIQNEYSTNLSLIHMLCIGINCPTDFAQNNNYLSSEEEYNKLRTNLGKANLSFRCVNACNLGNSYNNGQYDIVMLSNILDYFNRCWESGWKYDKLLEYINSLKDICNDDAIIFLKYIMMYVANNFRKTKIIDNSQVLKNDLIDEELHIVQRNGTNHKVRDGIILKRVK